MSAKIVSMLVKNADDTNNEITSGPWVTKCQLAKYLGCTPRYINILMRRRVLPYLKTRGLLRFDLKECDRVLEVFKTRSVVRPLVTPEPAPPAPFPPAHLPPPEPADRPQKPEAPAVCAKVFSSLGEIQSYINSFATKPFPADEGGSTVGAGDFGSKHFRSSS